MKIKKKVNGIEVILDYRRVKRYNNRYVLYNVYKILSKTKRIFLYRTCLSDLQKVEIELSGYMLDEEEEFE